MGLNVLIVDNSATVSQTMMRSQYPNGIELGTGAEPRYRIQGLFDLILSDIDRPTMHELELPQAISDREPHSSTAIVASDEDLTARVAR